VYQRLCPKCGLTIKYSNCRSLGKANKGNSFCKVCAGLGRFITDYTGQRFGRLVVIRRVLPSPLSHSSAWLVKCDCGSPERIMSGNQLKNRTGCGCWRPSRRRFTDKEKWCGACERWLPLDDFGLNRSTISGRADSCKVCFRNSQTARDNLRKYNLSPEKRVALEEKQGGKCAICLRVKKLCVDHNHVTGFVRGLLCVSCNVMLGRLNEDFTAFERAIRYLKAEFSKPVVGDEHHGG